MPRSVTGRLTTELFFRRDSPSSHYWTCRCGVKRGKVSTSYENLLSHVRTAHPDFERLLSENQCVTQAQIEQYFASQKSKVYYGWFNFIINGLLPFSFVEKPVVRDFSKFEPISLSTMMRYLTKLTVYVEEKISVLLPQKFALVFDAWSAGSTHYLAVYASFRSDNPVGYSLRLLSFSPMGDESCLNADEHIAFISFVLETYNKNWDNLCALVGDNCSTNKSIADKVSVSLIGCASHRFNLAVQAMLMGEENLLRKINTMMSKLKTLTLAAKLFRISSVRAKTCNATRWSSTFEMCLRYEKIAPFLHELRSDVIDDLRLTASETRCFTVLMEQLRDLESVTKTLQNDSTTLRDVRLMFDTVMDKFPETTSKLTANAAIVHSPTFEATIVKVQSGNQSALSRDERSVLSAFKVQESEEEAPTEQNLSFAQRALKRQKVSSSGCNVSYMDLRFLLPTSNVCERLFSRAGHVLNDRRKAILPSNLESQVFLHSNSDLWSASDINKLSE